MAWTAITDTDLSATCRSEIEWISESVFSNIDSLRKDFSLCDGAAGLAVYLSYLEEAGFTVDQDVSTLSCLEFAIEVAAKSRSSDFGLFSGGAGVMWAAEHLDNRFAHLDPDDLAVLRQYADQRFDDYTLNPKCKFDLVSGLAGLGVYYLERADSDKTANRLRQILLSLDRCAEKSGNLTAWRTAPRDVPEPNRKIAPDGYYDLGMAHGLAGVIALLSRLVERDVLRSQAMDLLESSIDWLQEHQLQGADSTYPHWVTIGAESPTSRLAWCYGDLGIASALLQAARSCSKPCWEKHAIEVAINAASRLGRGSGVVDAALCHGSGGVAHLFNRLFQATGDGRLNSAALFWIGRTLELSKSDRQRTISSSVTEELHADMGFLTGSIGIGLVLLASSHDMCPEWDQTLLVSVEPTFKSG